VGKLKKPHQTSVGFWVLLGISLRKTTALKFFLAIVLAPAGGDQLELELVTGIKLKVVAKPPPYLFTQIELFIIASFKLLAP
jgi:hypothetical protein